MTVMAEFSTYQRPQRRPVGNPTVGQPAMKFPPQQQYPPAHIAQQPAPSAHSHSRSASSTIFSPAVPHQAGHASHYQPGAPTQLSQHEQRQLQQQQQQQQQQQHLYHQQQQQQHYVQYSQQDAFPARRLTNSTVSSNESSPRPQIQPGYLGPGQPQTMASHPKSNNSSTTNLRRSTSSRSQASSLGPTSYVALLRKQKATVWCERTQFEDPRIAAQARMAKQRAANVIAKSQGRNSMAMASSAGAATGGGMLGGRKKLHGGRAGGGGANLAAGVNVPMRLSASEVGDEESDDDDGVYTGGGGGVHRRTNSGKSSLTGPNRLAAPRTNTRLSYGSGNGSGTMVGRPNSLGGGSGSGQPSPGEVTPPRLEHRDSSGSGNSEERREKEMGDVGDMMAPSAATTQEDKRLSKDELSRRGSVDERSATMRGAAGAMRLFVANPDNDSD